MSGPEPVQLSELDRVGVIRDLSEDQAAALASTQLVEVRPEKAGWRLLPAGRVGVAAVDGLQVQVLPKIGVARLLFLLGYAANPGFRPEDVTGDPEPDLWPALAESLARQVEYALRPGVLHGYVTVDDSLPLVRGRMRVADQISRHPGLPLPVELTYDEYAVDITENRLIRTALRRMLTVPGLRPELQAKLIDLDHRLDGTSVLPWHAPVPAWHFSRLNARYAPALRLADIVLRNQSLEAGPGGVDVAAFVVSMASVFEDFVTTALSSALASWPGETRPQHEAWLDEGEGVLIRPDVVHMLHDRPVMVFDAKYKLEDPSSGYPNADYYQMLAYSVALGIPVGWLVYAQGKAGHNPHQVRNLPVKIIPYALNLGAAPADLLDQVSQLVSRAGQMTGRLPPSALNWAPVR